MPQTCPSPETSTVISSFLQTIGPIGVLFGILCFFWNRRENRRDALSKVLLPMVRAAQHLRRANDCRRKCEQLKASFPDAAAAPQAVQRINMMIDHYDQHITGSEEEFRNAEAEYASRSFRFPGKIARLAKTGQDSLSEFGRLVNAGIFDKADVQLARFRDDYNQVTRAARGWRLIDPFERIRKCFGTKAETPRIETEYELSQEQMDALLELVHKRATTEADSTFAVHPPRKFLENPQIAAAENVVEELKDSMFLVVFQDGTTKKLSLVELTVLTYHMIMLARKHAEVDRVFRAAKPSGTMTVQFSFELSIPELMRPEMVKALLKKIEFADTASDE